MRDSERMQCPGCGAAALKWSRKRSDVTYRDRTGTAQRTHAMVRVATCATCGFAVRPPESLMAEHSAICRHIGVLAPEDIVAALDLGHAPDAPISDADDIAGLPA